MMHPVVDLHCDLLVYLASEADADPANSAHIGCAIPFLREGHVKLQVMAIYSGGSGQGFEFTELQCSQFQSLLHKYPDAFIQVNDADSLQRALESSETGIIASIENASVLCRDDEPLDLALKRFDHVLEATGGLLYVSLTHHGENRFGGGNNSTAGLKDDGRVLLDYMAGKRIAIDLSHTSDALACGILDHIERGGLDIPVIASHSNYRAIFDHPRNLPDELARVVIDKRGLIGANFLRAFVHPDDPDYLLKHIMHGFEIGAQDAVCFGADYFYCGSHPDQSRVPFYFAEHENAGKYPVILKSVEDRVGPERTAALASGNAVRFMENLWS